MKQKPSMAFIAASWVAVFAGILGFIIGLWNATTMQLNEKGYYFTVLMDQVEKLGDWVKNSFFASN